MVVSFVDVDFREDVRHRCNFPTDGTVVAQLAAPVRSDYDPGVPRDVALEVLPMCFWAVWLRDEIGGVLSFPFWRFSIQPEPLDDEV